MGVLYGRYRTDALNQFTDIVSKDVPQRYQRLKGYQGTVFTFTNTAFYFDPSLSAHIALGLPYFWNSQRATEIPTNLAPGWPVFRSETGIRGTFSVPLAAKNVKKKIFVLRPTWENVSKLIQCFTEMESICDVEADWLVVFIQYVPEYYGQRVSDHLAGSGPRVAVWDAPFIAHDRDVLEMGTTVWREIATDTNTSSLYSSALGLRQLERYIDGGFDRVMAKGDIASKLHDVYTEAKGDSGSAESREREMEGSGIDLYIVDRALDPVSMLHTENTITGVLHDLSLANCAHSMCHLQVSADKTRSCCINNNNPIFHSIQDNHFLDLDPYFAILKRVQGLENDLETSSAQQGQQRLISRIHVQVLTNFASFVRDILKLVKKDALLPALHKYESSILLKGEKKGNKYIDRLEDVIQACMADETNPSMSPKHKARVLRALCLLSVVDGGLDRKTMQRAVGLVVSCYGASVASALRNLEIAGLLSLQDSRIPVPPLGYGDKWDQTRRHYHLTKYDYVAAISEGDGSSSKPKGEGYVYSHYAPMTTRVVSAMHELERGRERDLERERTRDSENLKDNIASGITSFLKERGEVRRLLKGLKGASRGFSEKDSESGREASRPRGERDAYGDQTASVVFIVGGVTRSEVAAFRHLGEKEGHTYIVCSTGLVTGNEWMEQFM
ncbi:vacuolar protein sorting-associated protein 33 [Kipferlia bialata]|uniref:Vacuolar protein sorting-associated protein 33 n=1 Tax=Kipferlia bialata TaxID=797122 RepID=A0A9K3CTF2_9EUKA|nr:vacuolar protein sorting-associated protein 33 [Kipferlia bialata]|eukprot:g2826.t1